MMGFGGESYGSTEQNELYAKAVAAYGRMLDRLAAGYEADPDKRRDLRQDIHVQFWRSFVAFDGRCSLKTWTLRVAHNTAASYVIRERRTNANLISLEEIERTLESVEQPNDIDREEGVREVQALILKLRPLDRQIIISYLEGMDAASIADVTGLTPANIAMKVHRMKESGGAGSERSSRMCELPEPADARAAWLSQPEERIAVDIERLHRRRTSELFSTTRSEIIGSIGAAVFFAAVMAWRFAPERDRLVLLGCAGVIAWAAVTAFRFRYAIRRDRPRAEAIAETELEHYRGELLRRRDHPAKRVDMARTPVAGLYPLPPLPPQMDCSRSPMECAAPLSPARGLGGNRDQRRPQEGG